MARRRHLIGLLAGLTLGASGTASAQKMPSTPRPIAEASGILFFCWSLADEPWTKDLCATLDREAAALATTANVPFVAVTGRDDNASHEQKARAAGFASADALWLMMTVERTRPEAPRGWTVKLQVDVNALPQPEERRQVRRFIFAQRVHLDAHASRAEAEKEARLPLQAFFETFMKPGAPAR